ncbi:ANTAR domain-containing protein [Cellulosimicrobium cellulans]|uniref:ANTAR domain-containing protein n=1 Tax=Cellulosimicrobium cellulans TaxID=1710 RepID=UPI00130E90D2|nr:ANTAR domain-containing protein [Cellulosimicrobium cellulans]
MPRTSRQVGTDPDDVMAAVLAQNAALRRRVRDLELAMRSRWAIDQALGVIMAQNRCDAPEAFAILRRASQSRNQKMSTLARRIVAQVAGRVTPPADVATRRESPDAAL